MCLSKWKKISDCLEDAAKEKRFQGTKTSLKPLIKHLPPKKILFSYTRYIVQITLTKTQRVLFIR